jgi:hypothetical protein
MKTLSYEEIIGDENQEVSKFRLNNPMLVVTDLEKSTIEFTKKGFSVTTGG